MFDFSPVQLLIVLAIALIILGPRKLPEMAKGLGRGLREFRGSLAGDGPRDHPVAADDAAADAALLDARQEVPAPTPEIARAEAADGDR